MAVVADGGLAQRELNAPGRVWNTDDGEWVCEVLAEYGGQPARRLALAAGRFGATDPRMRQPLWELATDPDSAFDDRDEAMFYLARLGDEEVVRDLLELVRSQGTGPDHEDADGPSAIVLRATLALLAIGDLAALEELGQPGPLYDRAYLLALAGSADPRGVGVVEHMARSHPDLDHRAEAAEVLQVVAELLDPDVEEGPGDDDEPDPGDEPDAEAA